MEKKRVIHFSPCPPVTTASEERRAREQAEKVFCFDGVVGMGGPKGRTRSYDTQNPFDLRCEDKGRSRAKENE
ncbi:hypothetical protein BSSX_p0068 (plasmid) [Bacillus subtilis]|nr:hypothetical protein BSSX_p0068 [Bacillus subtilis]